jgi:hypothetical protein
MKENLTPRGNYNSYTNSISSGNNERTREYKPAKRSQSGNFSVIEQQNNLNVPTKNHPQFSEPPPPGSVNIQSQYSTDKNPKEMTKSLIEKQRKHFGETLANIDVKTLGFSQPVRQRSETDFDSAPIHHPQRSTNRVHFIDEDDVPIKRNSNLNWGTTGFPK